MSKTETKSTVLLKHHLKMLKLPTMNAPSNQQEVCQAERLKLADATCRKNDSHHTIEELATSS